MPGIEIPVITISDDEEEDQPDDIIIIEIEEEQDQNIVNNANNNNNEENIGNDEDKFNPKMMSEEERKEFNRLWYLYQWPVPTEPDEEREVEEVEEEVACWFCAFRFQVYTECKCRHLNECWDCGNIHDVRGECIN